MSIYKKEKGVWIPLGEEIPKVEGEYYPPERLEGYVIDEMGRVCCICREYIKEGEGYCESEGERICNRCRSLFFECNTGPFRKRCRDCMFGAFRRTI